MEDHPFPFQMHYIRTHYIREEQWGIYSMFTLKSNPAKCILCLSSPGRLVIWHVHVYMCGLSVDCVCRALLCVAVNHSRFLPGGHEDEPKGRVKQDWVNRGWKLRSWKKHYSNDAILLSFCCFSQLQPKTWHLVAVRDRELRQSMWIFPLTYFCLFSPSPPVELHAPWTSSTQGALVFMNQILDLERLPSSLLPTAIRTIERSWWIWLYRWDCAACPLAACWA